MPPSPYTSLATPSHPDFQLPWIQTLLKDPTLSILPSTPTPSDLDTIVTNSLWQETLSQPHGLRAHILFRRATQEPDSLSPFETCYIISIGPGIDGRRGRAHGGFSSLVLDQLTGSCARMEGPMREEPPATATMTVDYRAPIATPGVILGRSWVVGGSGRKVWTRGVLEDGEGRVCAEAKVLFVYPRVQQQQQQQQQQHQQLKGGKL